MAHKFRGNLRPRSNSAELRKFLIFFSGQRKLSRQQDVFSASFSCSLPTDIILIAGLCQFLLSSIFFPALSVESSYPPAHALSYYAHREERKHN